MIRVLQSTPTFVNAFFIADSILTESSIEFVIAKTVGPDPDIVGKLKDLKDLHSMILEWDKIIQSGNIDVVKI